MRRFTLLFATLLSLFWVTQVKADEITIYESATSTSYEIPIYAYNADTAGDQSEFVVPSSMLSDMSGKTITAITFYCANFSWGTKIPQYKVYMKEVNSETLSAYAGDTDATTVYEGELNLNGNQMTITLTTPYDYQGGHLLIGTKNIKAGSYVPKNSSTFYGSTASDVVCSRYSGGGRYFIPKTTFTYEATGSIAKPTAFAVSNITSNSATLNWTVGGEETAWQLVYGTAGFDKDAATPIDLTEPSYVLTDLTDNTTYEAYVRAKVGEDVSSWTNKVSFTTLLAPITTFPWTEDFNSLTSGIPTGWDNATGTVTNNSAKWTYYATGHDGAGLRFNSYNNQTNLYNDLKTPPMNFPSGKVMQLVFWYKNPKGGDFSVYISNDGGATYTTALATGLTGQTDWKEVELSIPDSFTDNVVIVFKGTSNYGSGDAYIYLDDVTVKEQPNEPKMVVTQPTSLDFGAITETTTKTFTIANTGLATLEGINVTSSNAAFTITGAPTSLEAGASQEVTITMSTANTGALSSDITVSATGMENVTFTVTGVVLPEGMFVVDFNDNALPEGWTNNASNKWSFEDGKAYCKSAAELITPKLQFAVGDMIAIKATSYDNYDDNYLEITGSIDGTSWTAFETKKYISRSQIPYGTYATLIVTGIPTTVKYLKFKGYYVRIDEIAGLTYAPVLNVTTGDPATAVSSPASYDFGECATDATVSYNFTNAGAGTININNVTITGEGAAAYSTNWTESTAAPFELKITRTYDATRTEAQAAVITVITSEGEFVINVTGTDKAANAPELAVDVTSLDFGKLTADDTKTVTVTNNGTGLLTVNIASDSEDFVVSTATLENIAAGESKTFDVTFKFSTNYGVKSGNITVTPTYDTEAVQTIAVTAKALDPDMWTEYFEGNALPTGWEAGSNWSFADGVAKAAYAYGTTSYLTTPKLEVSATTDELAFDYLTTSGNVNIKIQMSKDGGEWETCNTTPALATYMSNGTSGTAIITGLEPGIYQFRFANDDYQLDNFEGFKLKAAAAHEAEVANGGLTIPVTGNQYVEYTASVNVKVTGTNDEELTVKFYVGDTQYGEAVTKNVASNATETFEVTFTPDAAVNGDAYFTIESTDITAFQSNTVAVTIAAATVLDETVAPELTEGIVPSLLLKYTRYNGWNTICVPFELNSGILKTIFGKGWKAYEFKGYSDGTLNFETTTTFVAGYPYIIYVENAQTNTDDIVLLNVNISRLTAQYDSNNDAYFRGSYAPIADMNGLWGITGEGRIAKGTADASIDGFRAYFELPSTTTGAPLLSIDGGPATRIHSIDNGQLTIDNAYDLSGRRVAQPSKGLYIINGKKVILK